MGEWEPECSSWPVRGGGHRSAVLSCGDAAARMRGYVAPNGVGITVSLRNGNSFVSVGPAATSGSGNK
eukprot:gene10988-biopygen2632